MPSPDRIIWNKFHVHAGDNIPFCGWKATRQALAEVTVDLGYTEGAEIGVCQGLYSEILCKANPQLHLRCVDPWTPYRLRTADEQERNYREACTRLAPYRTTILRQPSLEAVQTIPDGSLDFVYIDGLHDFEPVMLDILHWAKKVRPGGMIAGHDYCWGYRAGVVCAVDAYVRGMGITSWYLTSRDREPSWLWIHR